jgi:hypothetical protein
VNTGFGLEVVLPFQFGEGTNVMVSNGGGTSGAEYLVEVVALFLKILVVMVGKSLKALKACHTQGMRLWHVS